MASGASPKGGAMKRRRADAASPGADDAEELAPPMPVPRKAAARPPASQMQPGVATATAAPKPQAAPSAAQNSQAAPAQKTAAAAQSPKPQAASAQKTISLPQKSVESDRVPSGIPGLDELIGGGYERNSTVVVTGEPGCGKTTFLAQFLFNGAKEYGDPGVMLSFEEQSDSIARHMKGYGFDFSSLEKKGLFTSISYRPHEVKKLIDEGGGLILDTITSIGAKRLAIDSLTSYAMLFESAYQTREAELLLFEFLQKWKCTTLMSAEGVHALKRKTAVGTASLADGVIVLHHPRHKSLRYRALEVLKMRGSRQSEKLCPFEFLEGVGLKVYPNEEIFYRLKEKGEG